MINLMYSYVCGWVTDGATTTDPDSLSGFVVDPAAEVPDVERMVMGRLTELGWLFK